MIKCRKCGELNEINYKTTKTEFKKANLENEMIIDKDQKRKGGVENG